MMPIRFPRALILAALASAAPVMASGLPALPVSTAVSSLSNASSVLIPPVLPSGITTTPALSPCDSAACMRDAATPQPELKGLSKPRTIDRALSVTMHLSPY